MSVVISNIISILKEQHSQIEKLVFCKNCKNSGHCYIENVFSFIHLQNGYCGAGVAKSKSKVDTGFQTLISNLENIDNIPNYQEVLQQANHRKCGQGSHRAVRLSEELPAPLHGKMF